MSDYIDLPYSMEKNLYGDISIKYDADAVKQSMIDILFTRKGEREVMPNYGSRIVFLLMEKINQFTTILLHDEIENALTTWEPRIRVNNIEIVPFTSFHYYEVTIHFEILRLKEVETLQLKLQKLN